MAALLFCEPLPVIPPGAYGHDVVVDMHTSGDADLQYSFGTSTDYMPLVFPLTLTAVEGEEREYTMNVVEKTGSGPGNVYTYSYIIDKRPPAVPAVSVSQGLYEGRLSVSFSNQEEEIFFSLNGSAFSRWQSKPLILEPGPDYITRHVIATYARDGSGNLSESAVYTYHLKNTGGLTMSAPVTIHSPQAGVFANDQYLVVEKQKDIRVYYTTDGTPPGQDDPEYTGPVILQKDGQVTVSVAAYNSAGKREYDTQIRYTVSRSEGRMVSRGSGLYDTGLHIEAMEKNLVYTLDDTRPTKESIVFNQSLRLSSVQKGTVLYTLQVAPMVNGEVLDIVFRYVYVIDNSIPREPKFIVNAVLPLNKPATLSMLGDRAAHLHYTLDGSTPGQDSPRYTGPIELSVDGEQGSHFVRGVAFDVHGKKSGEASMVIPYDTKPPAPPVVQAEKIPGGYVVKADDVFGTRTVFEAVWNTDEIPSPTLQSPVWTGDDSVRLPHGMEGTAMFVFMRFDEAGNGSEKIELPLYINNARYPEPVVLFEDGMCSISGEGNIRYAVFDGLRNSVVGEPLLAEYSQPFKIECPEGSLVEKTIAAYSHNGEGKVSNIVVEHIVIDRRIPVVPEIMNIQNHMVYTTSPIRLKPGPKDRDISLHYSFSRDGSEPEDPTSKSPQIENLLIETEEGQEVYYRVKILPLNSRTGRTGAVKELLFAVDRKMPVLPGVTGFTEGAVYNSKVGITLTGIEDGSTGYLSITTDGSEPGDPAVFGVPYSDTVYLYPADESEKPVRLRVGVRDQAGNSVNDPHEYRFTFDKIPPQSPVVEGLPPGGVSVKPLTLRISSPDAGVLYYRIAREDDFSRSESRQFIEYASPVFVDGAAGEKILYFLEVHAQDAVGNSASQPYRYSFVIDRSVPKEAPAPVFTRTGSAYIAEWQPGVSVEYSLDGSTFSLFTGPVLIDGTVGRLKYRLAGSDHVQEYDVPRIIELPSQFFTGVENGSRLAGQVTVQPRYSGGIIRYEVSIDSPSSVSSFSPVFEENLSFDVPSGLTRRYYLNYRYYETKDDLTGFALPPLSFTIDKSPPPVPGVRESIEGTGNKAQKVIQLYGEGNIFYRFAAQGREDPFLPYRDVIRLSSKGREYETYLLQAYAEDTLGNRSPVHEWELIIDQDIVYVSPDGNDYYDGSRLRPVKTLEKAVSLAREQKRTTLYVYPGEYTINRPLVLDSLHIVGSYGGNGTSVIKTGEYFSTDYALALVSGGKANISNIAFSNDSQQVRSILFSKGELTLTGCTVPEPGGTEYLIVQESGNIRMDAMQLSTTGNKGIFRQNGGTAE
ncbi:MAG: chitobiase/beta-hexosaminidase C-terminal domain-containing protein, partial [Spirochaetales bacterium]|nr:chitobiase/beta-hexosaminidase C-terminal domain-containing protein [Spirochaetales bacterium]